MSISCISLFYSKVETYTVARYPEGQDCYFLQHFKSEVKVRCNNGEFMTAPQNSIFIAPPNTPLCFVTDNDEYTHSLVKFKADKEFMDRLNLPYCVPFKIKNIEEIDKLLLEMQHCHMIKLPIADEAESAYMVLILSRIFEQLNITQKEYIGPEGNILQTTRLMVLGSAGVSWTAKSMAEHANMSITQYYKKYKELFGKTPMEELYDYRFKKSKTLIETGYSLSYVIESCGFKSLQHFSSFFKKREGIPPTEYQKNFIK